LPARRRGACRNVREGRSAAGRVAGGGEVERSGRERERSEADDEAGVDHGFVAGGVVVAAGGGGVGEVLPAEAEVEPRAGLAEGDGEAQTGAGCEVVAGTASGDVAGGVHESDAGVGVDGPAFGEPSCGVGVAELAAVGEVPAEADVGVDGGFVVALLVVAPDAERRVDLESVGEEVVEDEAGVEVVAGDAAGVARLNGPPVSAFLAEPESEGRVERVGALGLGARGGWRSRFVAGDAWLASDRDERVEGVVGERAGVLERESVSIGVEGGRGGARREKKKKGGRGGCSDGVGSRDGRWAESSAVRRADVRAGAWRWVRAAACAHDRTTYHPAERRAR